MAARTLYDKVWEHHVVKSYDDGSVLLYIDRHLVQEVSSPQSFAGLLDEGRSFRRPQAHIAVADHAVPTKFRDRPLVEGLAATQLSRLEQNCERFGINYIPMSDSRHGIVHVIGPELGFTLPGATLVCGVGYAIEYAGPAIATLSMEARMTLCNMSIEAGSRVGMVAPDEATISYVKGRRLAPAGAGWGAAVA